MTDQPNPPFQGPGPAWTATVRLVALAIGLGLLFLSQVFVGLAGWALHGQTAAEQLLDGLPVLLLGALLGAVGLVLVVWSVTGPGRRRLAAAAVLGVVPAVGYAVAILTDRF